VQLNQINADHTQLTFKTMTFTIYSKRGCPYCDKIKNILDDLSERKGYPILYRELGSDFTRQEFWEQFGMGSTFPQVVMGEKNLGGCIDTVKYLSENKLL